MQVLKSGVPCVTTSVLECHLRRLFVNSRQSRPQRAVPFQYKGGVGKGPGVSQSHVFPSVPRLNGKVPWGRLYATHYHTLFENSLLTLPKALFTLYRMSFAPARKPYRIGLLFTHTSSDFGANSVTKRRCASLRQS